MPLQKVLAVIPARFGSTRFPGKPLAMVAGEPMVALVRRRAAGLRGIDRVIVATDDERIMRAVEERGGIAEMTSTRHATGTSRVAEVAARHRCSVVLNIQGDEPLLPKSGVERLVAMMLDDRSVPMGTLASPGNDRKDFEDPDVVKVVCDRAGNALYFSRSPVPRSARRYLHHVGIYAYRRSFLLRFPTLERGPLEKAEGLEQLRALENGFPVRVITCRSACIGVDRPADIKRVEKRLRSV